MAHDAEAPADFLGDALSYLPDATRPCLDLACGRGRNAIALAQTGRVVVALDRNAEALRECAARAGSLPIRPVRSDIEQPLQIPLESGSCDAILVFRFLNRALAPEIERVLAPGGLLIYETFTLHQRELGYGPKNAAFLLDDGELPALFADLGVEFHQEGTFDSPRPMALARLIARKRRN